jgi:hypothetical protein
MVKNSSCRDGTVQHLPYEELNVSRELTLPNPFPIDMFINRERI